MLYLELGINVSTNIHIKVYCLIILLLIYKLHHGRFSLDRMVKE